MSILIIDNYDSFTYNLVHYLEEIQDEPVTVRMNDEITYKEALQYDRIILSPGPGLPDESGQLMPVLKKVLSEKPILGVCLGLQAITEAEGGRLRRLDQVHHGVSREVVVKVRHPLFDHIDDVFTAGRYHSWVADENLFPETLEILATDKNGSIMVIRHKILPVYAVQFHPESILTPSGKQLLRNWLKLTAVD